MLFLILLFLTTVNSTMKEQLTSESYLENLILKRVNDALSYDFPRDNSGFFKDLQEDEIFDYGSFDFIIIGSGSTGSVISNRLSARRHWKILLLEAGSWNDDFTDIPAMSRFLLRSENNWGYNTTSQKYGCKGMINNQCIYPRGKIVGGSSSINGLVYTRGNPEDYDLWKKLGNPGWGYQDVEPYFKKMENAQFVSDNLGHGGPMYINYSNPYLPFQQTFSDALFELGFGETEYNGEAQIGVSKTELNIKHGKRVSGANAYINPVLHRKNLNVTLKAFVTKILINETTKTAYGVRFVKNGQLFDAFAREEVILSAGAINSPQILMLSGIGPEYLLNKYNIPLIKELPVGETLIDHIAYSLPFSSNFTENPISLTQQISDFLRGEGLLATAFNGRSLSFVNQDRMARPTIEYVLIPPTGRTSNYIKRSTDSPYIQSITQEYLSKIDLSHFFSIVIILLHPKSTGKVLLQSSDPKDFPLIESQILSEEDDIERLYEAINFAINITRTEPFKKLNATVFSPIPPCFGHELYSKGYWYCAIRYMALPAYHSMGTTSMGDDPEVSVVNHLLKVHGIKNLRVADCGVIPASISGHTSGPAFMIGEKISASIKDEYRITEHENSEKIETMKPIC